MGVGPLPGEQEGFKCAAHVRSHVCSSAFSEEVIGGIYEQPNSYWKTSKQAHNLLTESPETSRIVLWLDVFMGQHVKHRFPHSKLQCLRTWNPGLVKHLCTTSRPLQLLPGSNLMAMSLSVTSEFGVDGYTMS